MKWLFARFIIIHSSSISLVIVLFQSDINPKPDDKPDDTIEKEVSEKIPDSDTSSTVTPSATTDDEKWRNAQIQQYISIASEHL